MCCGFDVRKEKNPCSLCAKMRRGALHELSVQQGCNKLALGHHFDDAVETLFLNLFYEGRLGCFSPVTWLSRAQLTTIRPMIYVEERDIRALVKREGYPVYHNPCCADGSTKRQEIKELIYELQGRYPGLKSPACGCAPWGRSSAPGWTAGTSRSSAGRCSPERASRTAGPVPVAMGAGSVI